MSETCAAPDCGEPLHGEYAGQGPSNMQTLAGGFHPGCYKRFTEHAIREALIALAVSRP